MVESSHYIETGSGQLHYLQWGSGKKLLLAFHGYGNSAAVFSPLAKYLGDAYAILSFDLPHHGRSKWSDGVQLKTRDVKAFVTALMLQYGVEKVSLMGYSMGGRVCMTVVEQMPGCIDQVALLATDGLVINRTYFFSTRTVVGSALFRHILERPERYIKLANWLRDRKWVSTSKHKFAMQHLQFPERRRFLLQVWPMMSDLLPKPSGVKRTIRDYKIPVFIFMGRHDQVMPPSLGEQFKKGLETVQLIILEKGHRVFDDTNAQLIAGYLL